MSELTRGRGKDVIRNQTTGEYEWGESDNQILTAALYTDMDLEMVKEAGSLYATVSVIIKGMGGYLLPQLLKSVTLESDGNITAEYTSGNRSSAKSTWIIPHPSNKSLISL